MGAVAGMQHTSHMALWGGFFLSTDMVLSFDLDPLPGILPYLFASAYNFSLFY
jgi:hypothetical protein